MTRTKSFVRIMSDVIGRPIDVADGPESTAIGAAHVARTAIGQFPSLTDAVDSTPHLTRTMDPDPHTPLTMKTSTTHGSIRSRPSAGYPSDSRVR